MTDRRKILLLWDIDDVLNRFMELCCSRFPAERKPDYGDLTVNPPHELLGITREEYLATLDACRPELYKEGPRPEIRLFFERHGHEFRHAALSAVPMRFAPDSAQWVLRHFGPWIQNCVFIPSPRPDFRIGSQLFRSKGEAASAFGPGAVLIDDSPANIADAGKHGCRTMLFPAPWNENRGRSVGDFLNELIDLK